MSAISRGLVESGWILSSQTYLHPDYEGVSIRLSGEDWEYRVGEALETGSGFQSLLTLVQSEL